SGKTAGRVSGKTPTRNGHRRGEGCPADASAHRKRPGRGFAPGRFRLQGVPVSCEGGKSRERPLVRQCFSSKEIRSPFPAKKRPVPQLSDTSRLDCPPAAGAHPRTDSASGRKSTSGV